MQHTWQSRPRILTVLLARHHRLVILPRLFLCASRGALPQRRTASVRSTPRVWQLRLASRDAGDEITSRFLRAEVVLFKQRRARSVCGQAQTALWPHTLLATQSTQCVHTLLCTSVASFPLRLRTGGRLLCTSFPYAPGRPGLHGPAIRRLLLL